MVVKNGEGGFKAWFMENKFWVGVGAVALLVALALAG